MSGLTPAAALALAQLCAPQVHPSTLLSVAWAESRWTPAAVHHNANGTADYGAVQINESNLRRFGLTRESALDPCLSMRAAARVLIENYHPIDDSPWAKRTALRRTIAAYNAGPHGGPNQPYVQSVLRAAEYVVPAINEAAPPSAATPPPPECESVDEWHVSAQCAKPADFDETPRPPAARAAETTPADPPSPPSNPERTP